MYKVYVLQQRKNGSRVFKETRTTTTNFNVAEWPFWGLYNDPEDQDHIPLNSQLSSDF